MKYDFDSTLPPQQHTIITSAVTTQGDTGRYSAVYTGRSVLEGAVTARARVIGMRKLHFALCVMRDYAKVTAAVGVEGDTEGTLTIKGVNSDAAPMSSERCSNTGDESVLGALDWWTSVAPPMAQVTIVV
eukprot:8051322-Pyramimonas_sp.AAC.1